MTFLTDEAKRIAPIITTSDIAKRRIIYQAIAEACVDLYLANRPAATLEQFTLDSKAMVYDIAEVAIVDRDMLSAAFRASFFFKTRKPKTPSECHDSAYFTYASFENFLGLTECYSPELIASINANFELFSHVYKVVTRDVRRLLTVELIDIETL